MSTTTIRTEAAELIKGDTVFGHDGVDRMVRRSVTDRYGDTWIMWADGERDSYPAGAKVYRIDDRP